MNYLELFQDRHKKEKLEFGVSGWKKIADLGEGLRKINMIVEENPELKLGDTEISREMLEVIEGIQLARKKISCSISDITES